jgi:hypothetical protein
MSAYNKFAYSVVFFGGSALLSSLGGPNLDFRPVIYSNIIAKLIRASRKDDINPTQETGTKITLSVPDNIAGNLTSVNPKIFDKLDISPITTDFYKK